MTSRTASHGRPTDCRHRGVSNHPFAERSLAENERVWQALSAEFDVAMAELAARVEAVKQGQSDQAQAAVQRAMQRCQLVESAINTFLDALDHSA